MNNNELKAEESNTNAGKINDLLIRLSDSVTDLIKVQDNIVLSIEPVLLPGERHDHVPLQDEKEEVVSDLEGELLKTIHMIDTQTEFLHRVSDDIRL